MVLMGVEPTKLWRSLAHDIFDWVIARDIENVLCVGAMLADVPHSRPVRLILSSEDSLIRSVLDIVRSSYEGPVGFLSVLSMWGKDMDMSTLHVWAQVPHYVHTSPSPKATLALLDKIDDLTGVSPDRDDLVNQAKMWEDNIDQLAAEDDDMTAYIDQLERARDTVEAPEASGDAIAREFERYLKRGPERPGGVAGTDS
jgi:predicted ATP-grasp superfamily ATP-dependent carboligase